MAKAKLTKGIRVRETTYNRLARLGNVSDSFDSVIGDLLDNFERTYEPKVKGEEK
jgi:predicted CopG family antitoxin